MKGRLHVETKPLPNPLLPNTSIVKPDDLTAWQSIAWDDWYAGFGCVVCGGYFSDPDESHALLYPALVSKEDPQRVCSPTLPTGSWALQCDCPAPRQSSACEVSPW